MIKRIFLIFLLCVPLSLYADIDASVSVNPTNPSPFQQVTLTLTSYSFDVNGATITWTSGNKTLLSGLGQKTISVQLGAGGQVVPISYKAVTSTGETTTGSITLTPQSVDLLYESNESYTPPFYEGKALPGEGALVKVIALPSLYENGKRVPPETLSYNWYVGGEYSDRVSGVGKQSALVSLDYLSDSTDVRVMVRSPRGSVIEKTISITPHDPLPTIYPYDDILGTDFTRPFIRRMELSGDVTLSLEPFYFSTKGPLSSTAQYAWYIDGLPVTPQEKTLLALKPKKGASGTRTLSVTLENSKRLLQKARSDIEILFDTR